MKALIKSGLCLALGWLASTAAAQESTQWKAASNSSAAAARPAITLSQPTPLENPAPAPAPMPQRSFRVLPNAVPPAIIRAQKADEKIFQIEPLPTVSDDKKTPQPMPKDKNFVPPPPTPMNPTPSPTLDGFGGTDCGDCCGGDSCCGLNSWGRFCKGVGGFFHDACRGGGCPDGSYRCWASAEYLMWFQKGQSVPPLITANPAGTPTAATGVLPGSAVLYGGVPTYLQSGGRFALGTWFPHFCCNLGMDVNFFFLARQSSTAVFSSNGDPQLSRPFFDTRGFSNAENFAINNATDIGVGTATVHDFTQLWGIGANLRYKWRSGPNCWCDLLFGYRHIDLTEGIDITEATQNVKVLGLADATHTFEQESFHTRNQFNGLLMGINGECRLWNRAYFGWSTNVSMGNMYQVVTVGGSTTFTNDVNPLVNGTQPGALLASPTNIGRYTANRFAVVPEIGFKLGYDITNRLRVYVGYDFLYMSSVVRPGEQIDLNVNQAFRPVDGKTPGFGTQNPLNAGPRAPVVPFRATDYWAQGLSFGLMYRY